MRGRTAKKSLTKNASFSQPGIIVFAVVFAAVGGYWLWRAFASEPYANGHHFSFTSKGYTTGWACEVGYVSAHLDIAFYLDSPSTAANGGNRVGVTKADQTTNVDCDGYGHLDHGFKWQLPSQYLDGKTHKLYAEAVDAFSGEHTLLQESPRTATLTAPGDHTPPSTPANLHVSGRTASSISLAWHTSSDSGSSGLRGYKITRNPGQSSARTTAIIGGTSYTDSGLNSNTSYTYNIKACDKAGNCSKPSSTISARTLAFSGGGTHGTACSLKGDLNKDCQVNITDLSILLTYYNTASSRGDINKDGHVNVNDLSILLSNYGK